MSSACSITTAEEKEAAQPTPTSQPLNLDKMNFQSQSPFHNLPPEIRNRITILICESTTLLYNHPSRLFNPTDSRARLPEGNPPPNSNQKKPRAPAYLLTCKKTYTESHQLLYAMAKFQFAFPSDLKVWAKIIPFDLQRLVTRLELLHDRSMAPDAVQKWKDFIEGETGLGVEVPLYKVSSIWMVMGPVEGERDSIVPLAEEGD
ncbi:uncharacterized protein RCC_09897 [Ramularia collo-cygni]|uniref:Uncharacterized protein n=1 Tax=Ramularia collo-cygni TaxID=112498 RepID=A0A2D3VB42_9PEZI|nr:uncharacterized protein RCC_09897 [Ramularia collo-cygni]CZT24180.1 uncharacterized protein RCC_09897 [Ramularia collo-cygni]